MTKKSVRIIIISIVTIIIIILSIFLAIKRNREHFAMHRKYDVEKIIITCLYDKDSRTWDYDGFEQVLINDPDEVKQFRKWLYDVDAKGDYLCLNEHSPRLDYDYTIEVCYEDDYIETIYGHLDGTMYKWLPQYEKAYSIGKSYDAGKYCFELFFDTNR